MRVKIYASNLRLLRYFADVQKVWPYTTNHSQAGRLMSLESMCKAQRRMSDKGQAYLL